MVAHVMAWLVRAVSTLVLVVSTGLALFVVAGGTSEHNSTASDVSTADTLRHLFAGEGAPPTPSNEGDLLGTWNVLSAPSREELDENLQKSLAGGKPRPYDQLPADGAGD